MIEREGKKGSGVFCRNGAEGASHKRLPTPFSRLSKTSGVRRLQAKLFEWGCLAATLVSILVLLLLLGNVLYEGATWLNWNFLTSFPSRFPAKAGIKSALWGSVWLIGLTTLFAVPIGIASAIYLEE